MRNKIIYIVLIFIVLLLIGGLFYNEFYLKTQVDGNKIAIYYAKKDIGENSKITTSDLVIKRIDPESVENLDVILAPNHKMYDILEQKLQGNITLNDAEIKIYNQLKPLIDNEAKLLNGKTKTALYEGEMILLRKISDSVYTITADDLKPKQGEDLKEVDLNIFDKLEKQSGLSKEEILILNDFLIIDKETSISRRFSIEDSNFLIAFKENQNILLEDTFNSKFEIKISPKWKSNITAKDKVRVYVQLLNKKTMETKIFEIFEKKEIKDINYVIKNGVQTSDILSVALDVSDKGALDYYNAMSLATATGNTSGIIMLKYNEVLQKDFLNVPSFKITSEDVKSIIKANAEVEASKNGNNNYYNPIDNNDNPFLNSNNDNKNNDESDDISNINNDTIQTITANYSVKDGDTMESIVTQFSTTEEKIKEDNPDIDFENLELGTNLKIVTEL